PPIKEQPRSETPYLTLLDEYIIAYNTYVDSTWVGGLSGIDKVGSEYVIICDDAGRYQSPRYYTASISFIGKSIDSIMFNGVNFFQDENEAVYKNIRAADNSYVDPESIRVDDDILYWCSEGFRDLRNFDPTILASFQDGKHMKTYVTDTKFSTVNDNIGPRHNASFEGLTLDKNDQHLWVSIESPLLQDGDPPSATSNGAPIRISKINRTNGEVAFEFGYQLEPIFAVPDSGAFAMNGAVEILWLGEGQLLVLERSYVAGVGNRVQLYRADYDQATDINTLTSLLSEQPVLASKTLLLDFGDLPVERIDNLEGICWGPVLPNGNRSLILVADNNFSDSQINQVLWLEVNKSLTD
ncbi:MAG: esterase-like activity of phytase family protein, partial [Bacteroidota bacterium]